MLRFATKTRLFHSSIFALKRTPFNLADIGEGISEVELIQWFVKEGDMVEEFSKICEVQSDKAAVEISSRYEGKILKLYHEVGAVAKVGSPLVDIDVQGDDAEEVEAAQPTTANEAAASKSQVEAQPKTAKVESDRNGDGVFATPAVRRIAREHKIDINLVKGTGPQNRVLKGDILAFVNGTQSSQSVSASKLSDAKGIVVLSIESIKTLGDVVKPFTPIQKAMFKSMTKSLSIPHFGFSEEITVNATTAFRKQLNQYLLAVPKGTYQFGKVSYMPIFLKAISEALKAYPVLNSQIIDLDKTPQLLFRSAHNIGIAMDTPNGLVVPNIKNVEQKSIFEICADLEVLKEKGQKGTLSNADLQGGTFTLSNIGNVGGTALHPVLVASEVCIGALGRVQRLPRFEVVDGVEQVVAKEIMHASFNADHRVIDGATVARFVQLWKSYLEQPSLLLANLK